MSHHSKRCTILALLIVSVPVVSYLLSSAEPRSDSQPRDRGISSRAIIVDVKVIAVDRKKMRQLGIDFTTPEGLELKQVTSEMIFNQFNPQRTPKEIERFTELLDSLVKNQAAQIIAEPDLAICDGTEAEFKVGNTVKVPGPQARFPGKGHVFLGTQLNITPNLTEDNRVNLEFRLRITDFDSSANQQPACLPLLEVHEFETGSGAVLGETLVLPGRDRQHRVHQTAKKFEEIIPDRVSFAFVKATLVDDQLNEEAATYRTARNWPDRSVSHNQD